MRASARRGRPWVLATGLVLLFACQTPVLSDVEAEQATAALAVLTAAGIPAQHERHGRRHAVTVLKADLPRAWTALNAAAALRPPPTVPPPRRWVLSPTEARLAARERQARDLEALLRAVPGVVEARVTLDAAGAAVVVRHDRSVPSAAILEGLVRNGAGLPKTAPIALALHPALAEVPDRLVLQVPDENGPVRRLTGAAVAGLAGLGLAWLLRRRRRRLTAPAVHGG